MILSLFRRGVKALGALSAGFALAFGLVFANGALAEPRVALVIGNSAYKGDMPALANPANDAKLMVKSLQSVGFDVVSAVDATQEEMKQALASFSAKLAAAGKEGTGLFFYAGHGVQVRGENYLIPIDAKIQREADVQLAAVSASTVLDQMEFAESAVNIIILDACRNNPLQTGERSASRGLAKIETAPRGSFIAYSTAPGSTAADGDGTNSPYTKALAETITMPGLSIADVFQEVRTKVLASTGNQQTPWDSSSLTGRFYFKEPDPAQTASPPPPAAAPDQGKVALMAEISYWQSVKDSGDPEFIQLYLNKYPNGSFVKDANAKLEELNKGTQVASAEQPSDARTGGQPEQPAAPSGQTVAKPSAPSAPAMSFIALDQIMYARSGGQMRAEPSTKAAVLGKLQANTEVAVSGISTDGEWWRVGLADGRTGYMHSSVVTEQPQQLASTAPAQAPAPTQPAQMQTLGADAFEPVSAPEQQQAPPQGPDVDQLSAVASQFLGINIPPTPSVPQPQAQQMASSLNFNPISETINVRAGAFIFNAAGGQPMFQMKQGGPLLATQRSSDGRWYQVSLPTGGQGYVPRQSVVK